MKTHNSTKPHAPLTNHMMVSGWLITFTYSVQQPSVFLSSPTVVPITLSCFQLCSDSEVVPLHGKSFHFESGNTSPAWPTDNMFVTSHHTSSHTLTSWGWSVAVKTSGFVKWNIKTEIPFKQVKIRFTQLFYTSSICDGCSLWKRLVCLCTNVTKPTSKAH